MAARTCSRDFSEIRTSGFKSLSEGQKVEFVVKQGAKGPQAAEIADRLTRQSNRQERCGPLRRALSCSFRAAHRAGAVALRGRGPGPKPGAALAG